MDLITTTRDGVKIWQGDEKAVIEAKKLKEPYLVVSLVGAFAEVFDGKLVPVLCVFLEDNNKETLTDDSLLCMVDSAIVYMKGGFDVVIHCFAGKHRSTYFDVALHMRLYRYGVDKAFEWIHQHRKEAEWTDVFKAQLKRMEKVLMGVQ